MKAEELMLALGKIDETLAQACLEPGEIDGTLLPENAQPAQKEDPSPELRKALAECVANEQADLQLIKNERTVKPKVSAWQKILKSRVASILLLIIAGSMALSYGTYKIMGSPEKKNSVIGQMKQKIGSMFQPEFPGPGTMDSDSNTTTRTSSPGSGGSATRPSSPGADYRSSVLRILSSADNYTVRGNGYTVTVNSSTDGAEEQTIEVMRGTSPVRGAEAERIYDELVRTIETIGDATFVSEESDRQTYIKDGMTITISQNSSVSYDLLFDGIRYSVSE